MQLMCATCFFPSLGNFGSAFVEVLVSDSSSPDQEVLLLPMAILMTANDSRAGRNKNKIAHYSKDKFVASVMAKKWNRLKIRCVQKHNLDIQFGLGALSVFSDSRDPSTTTNSQLAGATSPPNLLSPSQAWAANSSATPKQETPSRRDSHHQRTHNKYPLLPASDYQASLTVASKGETPKGSGRGSQTPKRPKEEVEDFEFSGVENQSRLFRECMKGKVEGNSDSKAAPNRILERIAAEREKYSPSYQRKRLLKKVIPKAEVIRDFIESYKTKEHSAELAGASRKLSSHGMAILKGCQYVHSSSSA